MPRQRTEAAQQVAELLRTARQSLGLSLAFLTRMDGSTRWTASCWSCPSTTRSTTTTR
jgi:hypothetical protein